MQGLCGSVSLAIPIMVSPESLVLKTACGWFCNQEENVRFFLQRIPKSKSKAWKWDACFFFLFLYRHKANQKIPLLLLCL